MDASVLVAWLWGHDRFHPASRAWIEEAGDRGVLLGAPAILPAEVAGPIARMAGRSAEGARATRVLAGLPFLELHEVDAWAAARLAADLRIRGCDAAYVELADRFAVPLLTHDAELILRASEVVPVLRPDNWAW